ncbi:alkaline phosphatase family protein [Enterococcus sp. LJL98]
MKKVAMILLDGCRYDLGIENLGYLMHLVEKKQATLYKVQGELPSVSRVCYEVLMTGTPAYENGITSNAIVRRSKEESIFELVKQAGGTSAAAAYYWISQLYNDPNFNLVQDRFQSDSEQNIQHGIYYDDVYPDHCLFSDGLHLAKKYQPDFLFLLPMTVDEYGHKFTGDSAEYREKIGMLDSIFATYLPLLIEEGYEIILTSDHGMDEFGHHGGTTSTVRDVPLFVISDTLKKRGSFQYFSPTINGCTTRLSTARDSCSEKNDTRPITLNGLYMIHPPFFAYRKTS